MPGVAVGSASSGQDVASLHLPEQTSQQPGAGYSRELSRACAPLRLLSSLGLALSMPPTATRSTRLHHTSRPKGPVAR